MSRKKSFNKISSLILTFAILFSFLGIETPNLSAQTTEVGPAITAAPESGQYVLVDNKDQIPTTIIGSWLLRENAPTDLNDAIQHAFTLNVSGDQVTLQDSTGTFISGNVSSNTIATGESQWQLRNNANGTFSFLGQGNGRILANNTTSTGSGYRAYRTSTTDGNSDYGTEFSLHPLVTGTPDPDPIQPSLEVQNIVVEQGEEFALSDTVVNHVGELSFNYPPSLILTPVPGTDLVTTDSIGEHEIAVTASNENGEVVEYPTIEVVWAEPEVVEAPSFREEVIYSGETVLGVFAKLNDTVNLEVVRDGTVVYSGETDIETNIHVNSGKQMYIPRNNAPQAGDVIRIWVTNIHGTSEAVEKTVLDNSEILQLVVDPIYRGDTKITGTVNPEATSLGVTPLVGADALGAAAQTYRFGEDGSFEITHSTLASRIIESDSLFFSASIDGQYYRLTIPTELLELEAPRIAVISDQDTSLSIFAANEGDLLRVTLPSGEVIEEPARRLGRLPVLLDAPLTAGEVVTVVTYSPNGAVSEEAAQTVIVASEQFELNVDPIYVGDQYITGTATPGSQVFVRNLGGRNVTADAEGNFSINLQGSSSDLVKDFEVEFQVRVDNKTYNAATVTVLAHTYPITLDTIGTTVGTDGEVLDLPTEAEEGETVVFRVQPNPSHYANRVRVDFGDGNRYVDIERNEDGTFSFVMPANEVKVRVSLTNFNTNFQPTRTTLDVGETEQFTFSINKGRDDVVVENPVWSIEDESVAVVDQTGLVTAVAEGETTVVFTYTVEGNELSREASVTVNPEIFTVTIDANEGTIDAEAATTEVVDGETFTVPYAFRTNLERVGHSLVGYSVEGTLLDADGVAVTEVSRFPADYTVGSDVTLTAIWEVTNGSLDLEVHDDEPHTQADRYTVTLTAEDETVFNLSTSSRGSEHARWEVEDLPNGVYTLAIDGYTITSGEKTGGDRDTVGSITVNEDGTAVLDLTYADDASSAFARFDIHGEVVRPAAPEIEVFGQHTNIIKTKTAREDGVVTIELSLADGTVITKNSNTYGNTTFFFEDLEVWPTLEVGDVVTAVAINADGVRSEVASYTVPDAYEITGLTVDPIYPSESGSTITGTVNPNAIITVHFPNGSQAVTIDDAGNWTIGSAGRRLEEGTPVNLSVVLDGETYRFFRVYETVAAPHTVTIDANGGTMNDEYVSTEVAAGETYTVPYTFQSLLSREGYTLTGYTVEGTLLDADGVAVTEISKYTAEFTPESDVTLTAVWEVTNGKFQIDLHDDEPATQADRYEVTLTAEDGTVHNLTTSSRGSEHASWEVEDVANGTYTLAIDGFTITEAVKNGHPDTVSTFTVNEDGTATVELTFEDEANSTFIRYDVHGEEVVPNEAQILVAEPGTRLVSGTGTPGARIRLRVTGPDSATSTATVIGEDGTFSFNYSVNFPALADGFVVDIEDRDDNSRILDTLTIEVPNEAQILVAEPGTRLVSGTGTPGARIRLRVTGPDSATSTATVIGEDGTFSFNYSVNFPALADGFVVDIEDRDDNSRILDTLTIEVPNEAQILVAEPGTRVVSGTGTPGARIRLRVTFADGTQTASIATVSEDGTWSITYGSYPPVLSNGDLVQIEDRDDNNRILDELTIVEEVPNVAEILVAEPGTRLVEGTGTPGARIRLRVTFADGTQTASIATVSEDGTWSITYGSYPPVLSNGDLVQIEDRDDNNRILDELTIVEEVSVYGLGVEVRGLDGRRTEAATVTVTDSEGVVVAGDYNEWSQWLSSEDLVEGTYTITLVTPEGTVAVINDTVATQAAVATEVKNEFTIELNDETLGNSSSVFGAFVLVEAEPAYRLGVEVRDLTGARTQEATVTVTDSEGVVVTGNFNEWSQWLSSEELAEGTYTITFVTPEGTEAAINDSVSTQVAVATEVENEFTIELNDETLGNLSAVYGAFVLVEAEVPNEAQVLVAEAGTRVVEGTGTPGARLRIRITHPDGTSSTTNSTIGEDGTFSATYSINSHELMDGSVVELEDRDDNYNVLDTYVVVEEAAKDALEILNQDETFNGEDDFSLRTNGDIETLEEVVIIVNGERIVLTPDQYTAVSGSTIITIPAEVLNALGLTEGDTFEVEVTQSEGAEHEAGTVTSNEVEVVAQETTPTTSDEEPTPTSSDDETTPTSSDDETTPTSSDDEPTPTSSDDEPTPTSSDDETTPTSSDEETTPTSSDDETTPTSSDDETTPTSSDDEVDTTALEEAIAEAEAVVREDMTPESLVVLDEALEAGREVLANPDATQEEVDTATEALLEALAGLDLADPDASETTPSSEDETTPSSSDDETTTTTAGDNGSETTPSGDDNGSETTPSGESAGTDTDATTEGEKVTQTGESSTHIVIAGFVLMLAAGLVIISILRRRNG